MNAAPDTERLEQDLLRYFDGVADEAQSQALRTRLLQDADARRVCADLLLRQQLLVEASLSAKATRQLEEVAPASPPAPRLAAHRRSARPAARGGFLVRTAIAAALAVAATAYFLGHEDPCAARVAEWQPGNDGPSDAWSLEETVRPGRTIALAPDARLRLRYPDGCEIECSDGARLALENRLGAKGLRLESGQVQAVVVPQPREKPFALRTARTLAEVLGTRLRLVAGPTQDLLVLEEGAVRFVRSADGAETRVAAGEWALADDGREPPNALSAAHRDLPLLARRVLRGEPLSPALLDAGRIFAEDMTLANAVKPFGVPPGYGWLEKPRSSLRVPDGWNAATMWGRVAVGHPESSAVNVRVQVADLRLWWLGRKDGAWHVAIQDDGPACRYDAFDAPPSALDSKREADGSVSVRLPRPAEHLVLWPTARGPGRAEIAVEDIAGLAACFLARLVVDDPAKPDDREAARIVAACGGSFFPDVTQPFKDDFSNSAEWGFGRFKLLTGEWQAVTASNVEAGALRAHPPPLPLR